jgi:photosystem II stability/assembly factor-like uncharacterized protein
MTPHVLCVGTVGEGVFRSLDHGDSFRRAMDGMFVECHVRALVCHPDNPRLLFLGCEEGLFRSDDGADSWSQVDSPLNGLQIWSLHFAPGRPERMFAGTCPSRFFRSLDGGRSWEECPALVEKHCPRIMRTRVTSFAADGDAVWAGVEIDSVWHSGDGGRSWRKTPEGLSSPDIHNLAIVPASPGRPRRFVATTNNDVNLSDDGETWRRLDVGRQLPLTYCRGLTLLPGEPRRLLLGVGDGPPGSTGHIAFSDDAGETWRTAAMPGSANSTIWNFAAHPADPSLVYASSVSGQVYRSTDRGESWARLGREFGEVRALLWLPQVV